MGSGSASETIHPECRHDYGYDEKLPCRINNFLLVVRCEGDLREVERY